ncbi:MAG: hypothetical protein KDE48_00220 [Anaerolineales bacterium]|nr:hypothetical protein [Anaerolineales bacterium]
MKNLPRPIVLAKGTKLQPVVFSGIEEAPGGGEFTQLGPPAIYDPDSPYTAEYKVTGTIAGYNVEYAN